MTTIRLYTMMVLVCVLTAVGCNNKPATPHTKWYKGSIKTLAVDQNNPAEVSTAQAMENARGRYRYNIATLVDYYHNVGNEQKAVWASGELKNLDEAQEFDWIGVTPATANPTTAPADPSEHELVENNLASRRAYIREVDELAQFYETAGDGFKSHVIHTVQARLQPERMYLYLANVEVPSKNLRPIKIYPKANQLFDEALALYKAGKKIPAMTDYDKERQALKLFKQIVKEYPDSTRIPMSAFYIGEIYKKFFKEHYLAALWYERAWTWDPYVEAPVRFQAAVLYDYNLHDKEKALSLYRASLKLEPRFASNSRFSKKRIEKLQSELRNK